MTLPFEAQLQNRAIPYEIVRHDVHIRTAKEGAEYFGIGIGQTAPTLVLHTDLGYYALIVSGDRGRVDFERVAAILSCKSVRLATHDEVRAITGFRPGAVAMVGLPMPYLIDQRLLDYEMIYGGTGEPDSTLKIHPKALLDLCRIEGMLD